MKGENFMSRKKLEKMLTTTFAVDYNLRYIIKDGVTWWAITDVCKILDLTNPTMVANSLEEDERAKFNLGRSPINSGGGETNFVNEFGLYRLIFRSRKPEAKEFQRWVFHEVLPSIRKTGSYSIREKKPRELKISPAIKKFKILEPIELDLSKDTKKVRKFKLEHPKYQDCADWIEYDRITEIPIDEEFRNFYNEGGDPEDWIREMKKFGRVKFLEVGV